MTNRTFYRPDIDGLRAIAVVSVIIFHINANLLPGGFLGVDIFFVISGFLITSLLLKELQQTKKISLKGFYVRRVKRIIPALLVVVVTTLLVGFLILTPTDFLSLLKSAVASLLSLANVFFYFSLDQGYFAKDTAEVPLLHMWSLAVEEQFYLIWPLLMAFIYKKKGSVFLFYTLLSILLLSLILAQISLGINQPFAYYSLPTRAWELAAGGALSIYLQNRKELSPNISNLFSLIGVFLIGASFLYVSKQSDIPGIDNIPLIIGTLLLIVAGKTTKNISRRLLSNNIIVFIGLVSYSAYLWHWPMIAFTKYATIEIDIYTGSIIFVLTFLLASLTYYLVENPLRKLKITAIKAWSNYYLLPVAFLGAVSVSMAYGIKTNSPYIYDWKEYSKVVDVIPNWKYDYNCQYTNFGIEKLDEEKCIFPQGEPYKTILIGDSNGAHYIGMFQALSSEYNFSFKNITQSACPTLLQSLDLDWVDKKYQKGCLAYRKYLSKNLDKYDHIIMGGDWTDYDRFEEFRPLFIETINKLAEKAKKVTILAKIPTFKNYNVDCEKRKIKIDNLICSIDRYNKVYDKSSQVAVTNTFLLELSKKYSNVDFINVDNILCPNNICSPVLNKKFIYADGGHLHMKGSYQLGRYIIEKQDNTSHLFKAF
jgi:peptidoglycan/LPS O-acetylase OafA/YrhL